MDCSGQELLNRIANTVYEDCRANRLVLPGFPDFQPAIAALKNGINTDRSKSYRVSTQVHDKLVVLQSYAQRWLDGETTKEQAQKAIEDHNDEFNPNGDFVMAERTLLPWSLDIVLRWGCSKLTFTFHIQTRWDATCCRTTEASNETSHAEERPAKRIKIEECNSEEVSKLVKPCLGWKSKWHTPLLANTPTCDWTTWCLVFYLLTQTIMVSQLQCHIIFAEWKT